MRDVTRTIRQLGAGLAQLVKEWVCHCLVCAVPLLRGVLQQT